jgi:hypothetical protein
MTPQNSLAHRWSERDDRIAFHGASVGYNCLTVGITTVSREFLVMDQSWVRAPLSSSRVHEGMGKEYFGTSMTKLFVVKCKMHFSSWTVQLLLLPHVDDLLNRSCFLRSCSLSCFIFGFPKSSFASIALNVDLEQELPYKQLTKDRPQILFPEASSMLNRPMETTLEGKSNSDINIFSKRIRAH